MPDPGRVDTLARRILSRPEFRNGGTSWAQRFLDWLQREFSKLGHSLGGGSGGIAQVLSIAVIVLIASVAVFLIARSVIAHRGAFARDRSAAAPAASAKVDWLARADDAEASGNWREALRCRYRASVASLASVGVVEEIPGRTAGEYRTLVGYAAPKVADDFGALTDGFEHAWYTDDPVGPDDSDRSRVLARAVESGTK